ncbi:MAG: phosphoenolpyruvate carboxykinase, partial [Microbacteriaceae bacterium]|nr:phosphoenolpyruvate carboxykinase [Microbacteriaceae bacterium]
MTITPTRTTASGGTVASAGTTTASYSAPEGTAQSVVDWVAEMAAIMQPDSVVWCDGSAAEFDRLTREMVASGTLTRLNAEHRPYSFLARSNPNDV